MMRKLKKKLRDRPGAETGLVFKKHQVILLPGNRETVNPPPAYSLFFSKNDRTSEYL